MNILFLFVSLPSLSVVNGLHTSLINEFKNHGHKVLVSSRGDCLNKTTLQNENDIHVLRIKAPKFTAVKNKIKKALSYQLYVFKQCYYIKKKFRNEKIDVVYSHSLPPELGLVIQRVKKIFKCSFFLEVSDFTWQDAVSFGYFRESSIICHYYKYWERKLFELADFIGVPTQGNVSYIKRLYPNMDIEKFHIIPFWQTPYQITESDYCINNKLGLRDKFVVVYGGSIGVAQHAERLVELADSCKLITDIVFLVLGRGERLLSLKKYASDLKLNNIVFYDYLPQEQYLNLLSTCDVGLILLNEKMATPNFPSKALSYFNLKVPVLAALDYVTDFGVFLDNNKIGLWAHSDNIN